MTGVWTQCTYKPKHRYPLYKTVFSMAALGVLSSFIVPERRTVLSTASNKKNNFFVAPASLGRSAYGMSAVGTF